MTAKAIAFAEFRMSASDFGNMVRGVRFEPPRKEAAPQKLIRSKMPKKKSAQRKAT
jgi:hypothetical protein